MPAKRDITIFRIIVVIVLFIVAKKLSAYVNVSHILIIVAYVVAGINVIKRSFAAIFSWELFDENFLMSVATMGALVTEQYAEAIAVMLIYEVGEMMQDKAVDDSKKAIINLIDTRPKYVSVKNGNNVVKARPENIKVGDIIVVGAGENVSLDGVVVAGKGNVDFSSLTGESIPKYLKEGDFVYSGGIIKDATLHIKVTKLYSESTLSRILKFIQEAGDKKSTTERFMTKFSKRYTPVVIGIALLFVVLARGLSIVERIRRACMFLVIACPCALVLSLPLCFFYGIGICSKRGILVKGSAYIEMMSNISEVIFDKTGTLTSGEFGVTQVNNVGELDVLEIAAHCEADSGHPLACAIKKAYGKDIDYGVISNTKEVAGRGTSSFMRGAGVLVGSKKFMQENNVDIPGEAELGAVYVAYDGKYIGDIVVRDEVRDKACELVNKLKADGISVAMITGDSSEIARRVAKDVGIDEVYSEVFPEDKAKIVKDRMKSDNDRVAFVGDGINDVLPILTAHVGISMGGIGSDVAIEAADVVLMDDDLLKIGQLVDIAKVTMHTAKANIVFVLAVKLIVLVLCALGKSPMWGAILADVGVSIIAIMHSTRELLV